MYLVLKQPPKYHQMTIDEFLFGPDNLPQQVGWNEANTRTYVVVNEDKYSNLVDVQAVICKLVEFNASIESLRAVEDRHKLYRRFYIPKSSGGLRRIDAPNDELMAALRRLKDIFEIDCKALYHTAAFAYIKHRSTLDAVKRHQANKSRWFAKFDLSDFFGSTTLDFVMEMFGKIFPFCKIIEDQTGKVQLRQALELAFLDGGLPQGTPISPLITNIMMIPIDYMLSNQLRRERYTHKDGEEATTGLVYTRYADDFIISSRYSFNFREVQNEIVECLKAFNAPFTIKPSKTRYGSSAGSNWILGVMLNKNGEITIGYKKKKQFIAMLSSYAMDKISGVAWSLEDIQAMDGLRSYYRMVEGENIDGLVNHLSEKFGLDIILSIKADLRGCPQEACQIAAEDAVDEEWNGEIPF